VNNAGRNNRKPMAMESFEEFWAGVELNLKGVSASGLRDRNWLFAINVPSHECRLQSVPGWFSPA
jgi:hypothetical protein